MQIESHLTCKSNAAWSIGAIANTTARCFLFSWVFSRILVEGFFFSQKPAKCIFELHRSLQINWHFVSAPQSKEPWKVNSEFQAFLELFSANLCICLFYIVLNIPFWKNAAECGAQCGSLTAILQGVSMTIRGTILSPLWPYLSSNQLNHFCMYILLSHVSKL